MIVLGKHQVQRLTQNPHQLSSSFDPVLERQIHLFLAVSRRTASSGTFKAFEIQTKTFSREHSERCSPCHDKLACSST